jgi:hypothetical protein
MLQGFFDATVNHIALSSALVSRVEELVREVWNVQSERGCHMGFRAWIAHAAGSRLETVFHWLLQVATQQQLDSCVE